MDDAPVFVITGQLSSGKSTVAKALLGRFPFGYHIDVDAIREMVVSGLASPLEWTEETTRQFSLAIDGAVALARVYRSAGFAIAIEGGMDPALAERALATADLMGRSVGIVLHPRLDVALERNRARTTKAFDTAMLEGVMLQIDQDLAADEQRSGWTRIDNSDERVERTVERILSLVR